MAITTSCKTKAVIMTRFWIINLAIIIKYFLDPRVNDWFLMSSPFPTLFICLTYAYCVKVLGPKLMENRKPFDLKYVLIAYNLIQVIFSTWLFHEVSHDCVTAEIVVLIICDVCCDWMGKKNDEDENNRVFG